MCSAACCFRVLSLLSLNYWKAVSYFFDNFQQLVFDFRYLLEQVNEKTNTVKIEAPAFNLLSCIMKHFHLQVVTFETFTVYQQVCLLY